MASIKGRGTKRSSSSSYTSTITVAILVAICVFCVWMLTSNSVIPQQEQPVATARTSQSTTSGEVPKNDPPPFEDNPGDLPDDALKPDDNAHHDLPEPLVKHENDEPEEEEKHSDSGDHQLSEESSLTHKQEVEENTKAVEEEEKAAIEDKEKQQEEELLKQQSQSQEQQLREDEGDQQKGNEEEKKQEKEEEKKEDLPSNDTSTTTTTTSNSPEGGGESGAFPGGETAAIPKESKESKKAWSTQADESENQKERRKDVGGGGDGGVEEEEGVYGYTWKLCNVTSGADYIPCLDNEAAISKLRSRKHFEHRERHCPEEPPTCLVPIPSDYKKPIVWPASRDKIWYHNVPHTLLAEVKGHQNWVKVAGEFLIFPGGGTQFIHGALHYIDFLQNAVAGIAWGKKTRMVLDVGCGVASFGGFLFERDVLTMSFAPKDEHVAQVQFALERGIPAISAVMGSKRLPFPSRVFDIVHCARCRVPWHAEGGLLLLELNRVLRPGGYFVWSATPVYQKLEEDVQIWKEMSALTESMCWEVVTIQKDGLNSIAAAIYRKPDNNQCYEQRRQKEPVMCSTDDDANAAWYVPLQACMHRAPEEKGERGSKWPEEWPQRLQAVPFWLNSSQMGIYGRPAPDDFVSDSEHWRRAVGKTYLQGLGINWSDVRNVMDMRAVYGGFAAALKGLKVWVMNVVNVDSPDTLPIIYERGLMGIYHDWCESFSTYPRTYDLLHADHLFSRLKKRCRLVPAMAEVDRIVRPGGKLIVRDESGVIEEVVNLLKSLHWEVHLTFSKNKEGVISAQKYLRRPASLTAAS